jgi:hypothetical protein
MKPPSITILCLACVSLAACVTIPHAPTGATHLGLVQYVNPKTTASGVEDWCKTMGATEPRCKKLDEYDIVSTAISRNWWGTLHAGVLVPKTEHVHVDDIIEFREPPASSDRAHTHNSFILFSSVASSEFVAN